MPKYLINRWHGLHQVLAFVLLILLTVAVSYYNTWLGAIGLIGLASVGIYSAFAERAFRRDLNAHFSTIMLKVNRAGQDVASELPFGIIVFNEDRTIEWHNGFVSNILNCDKVIGQSLYEVFPVLKGAKDKEGTIEVLIGQEVYELLFRYQDHILYIRNVTQRWELAKKYEEEKPAIGLILLDSLDEVTQGMDDQQQVFIVSKVTAELSEWAARNNLFMKKYATDKFLIITDQRTLKMLEQSRFTIIDSIREITTGMKVPLTISIGIAAGSESIPELGRLAQLSLDIALSRGGDQASVRVGQRRSFYGGKSTTTEKRTRVKARSVAHAFRDHIHGSSNVLIMGHKIPDIDSVGASVGAFVAAQLLNKEAHIVIEGRNPSIDKLMDYLNEDARYAEAFITPEQALTMIQPNTLVVVVDTHKASMVKEPRIIQNASKVVIIDHHRRGEEFIDHAMQVYLETSASSACELISELLPYITDRPVIDNRAATTMLAGIALDTKNFSLRTYARTFEAASFLKKNGADSNVIQQLLKEDLHEYIQKSEVIKNAEIIFEHIAIAVTDSGKKYPQLLIAQSADTLLNMTGIYASFVIAERTDGLIAISARSLGQMNVQVVMERMGGGGHLTNAAAQIEGTVYEAEQKLKKLLNELNEEERLFE